MPKVITFSLSSGEAFFVPVTKIELFLSFLQFHKKHVHTGGASSMSGPAFYVFLRGLHGNKKRGQ